VELVDEVAGWIRAFAFTQTIEVPLYLLAFYLPWLRGRIGEPVGPGVAGPARAD